MKPQGDYHIRAWQMLICFATGFVLLIAGSLAAPPESNHKLNLFYKRLRTPVGSDPEIDKISEGI